MFADRIPHFLWASVILACYLARERRLEECFAVSDAATRLAIACGIGPRYPTADATDRDYNALETLLSPPIDEAEAMDRIRLAHSYYLMDQVAPVLGGSPPSFPYDDRWALTAKEASLRYQYGKDSFVQEGTLSELWSSDVHFKVLLARTHDRIMSFVQSSHAEGSNGTGEDYTILGAQITSQHSALPPLVPSHRPRSQQAADNFNPNMLSAHTAMYGNGLLLHTVRVGKEPGTRREMLKCLDGLLGVCESTREYKRLHKVQPGLMNSSFNDLSREEMRGYRPTNAMQ
ncbi:hypothetical protein DL93DRAFT_414357 [Clavulina sp. PMI_390]|nr:hypothetical protein DL93DRAFT_414357 [Clavulina sp. PMI_390]